MFPVPESFVVHTGRAIACAGAVLEEPEGHDAVEVLAVDRDIPIGFAFTFLNMKTDVMFA